MPCCKFSSAKYCRTWVAGVECLFPLRSLLTHHRSETQQPAERNTNEMRLLCLPLDLLIGIKGPTLLLTPMANFEQKMELMT